MHLSLSLDRDLTYLRRRRWVLSEPPLNQVKARLGQESAKASQSERERSQVLGTLKELKKDRGSSDRERARYVVTVTWAWRGVAACLPACLPALGS